MGFLRGSGGTIRSRVTRGAGWLIALEVGLLLLTAFAQGEARRHLVDWLVLTPASLARGHVWKLLTTSLMNVGADGSVRGLGVVLDVAMLVLFIPFLESALGTRRFLRFAAASCVAGNLLAALVGLSTGPGEAIVGLSGLLVASVVAFGVLYAGETVQLGFILPVKGRAFALGTAAFLLVWVLLMGAWAAGAGFAASMAVGWIWTAGTGAPRAWWLRFRRKRLRKRIHVIDGGAERKRHLN